MLEKSGLDKLQFNKDDYSPKIAIISTHFPPMRGGVETAITEVLNYLDKKHISSTVITYDNRFREPFKDHWRYSRIRRTRVPKFLHHFMFDLDSISKLNSLFKQLLFGFFHIYYLTKGGLQNYRQLKQTKLIIGQGAFIEAFVVYFLSIVANKKYCLRWHTDITIFSDKWIYRLLLKRFFKRASFVITNGEDISSMSKKLGAKRALTGKHGVNTGIFYPKPQVKNIRKELSLPQDKTIILSASALNDVKFVDVLVDSFEPTVLADSGIYYVLVGEGPLDEKIRSLERKYPKNLMFINKLLSQESLSKFISASDVVFGCADTDYTGRLVLETLSCGVPVLLMNRSIHPNKRNLPVRIKIPLEQIFLVEPNPKKVRSALLKNKARFRQIKSLKAISANNYIGKNHSVSVVLAREFEEMLRIAAE